VFIRRAPCDVNCPFLACVLAFTGSSLTVCGIPAHIECVLLLLAVIHDIGH
jgi:hypothetical protein